ncbi:cytochrome P450 [Streptomyces albireticuli]|uniref:Cytochrome P450 n=1 Tax=Streptomyces albireticuli TaxID=1940 RepID=A0A2A2D5H2_9ACTN|nr:cytochrome P450 [Streptomyces albireticuli]MCD9140515.1 cytochrome P450 [Streptomyces albireticuli]MCD9161523.1 cytochrome P450 [Streptomyces albireticuli]MCD9192907.1 cytochrome P450 [Streptomyces albireticuli]PAU46697.1 cytochrome P450 [Streptomyces albireticuli]
MTEAVTEPLELSKEADAQELLAWFAFNRAHHPVFWDEGRQAWQVFRYDDYLTVSTHPEFFSSDFNQVMPTPPELEMIIGPGTIGALDPPAHGPMRKLVSQAFTPKRMAALEPRIREINQELLDQVRGRETIDVVGDLSYALPVIVIAELLGIPASDRDVFREWVDTLLTNEGLEYPNLPDNFSETIGPALQEMTDYLLEQIRNKRENPADDLITGLVQAEQDGVRLTDVEIVNIVALLLTAGHVSSSTLLSNLFLVLEENPQALADLRADRELAAGAIEETLRYRSPFNNIFRFLKEDTDILGPVMKKGEMVIAWSQSANRDPGHFPDPDTFDIRRTGTRHMAFGHGIHHCLGAFLARLEGKVLLELLLDQVGSFRIDHDNTLYYEADQLTAKYLPVHVEWS